MLILNADQAVCKVNSTQRRSDVHSYHHLLSRLSPVQRHFLETGQGTPPYIDKGYALNYCDPNNLTKKLHNRFVCYTGETKTFLSNLNYWMDHLLLHRACLNRMFALDTFNRINAAHKFKWISQLVVLSRMNVGHVMQMQYLDLTHLESLDITIDGMFTEAMANEIVNTWRISRDLHLTVHGVKGEEIAYNTFEKLMNLSNFKFSTYAYRNVV